MIKVLFVCLGNICRSPMAEAVFRHKVKEQGLDAFISADSAGTGAWHVGERPHQGTRDLLAAKDIDFTGIVARKVIREDFHAFDYIIAMDSDNVQALKRIAMNGETDKVYKLLDFVPESEVTDVPDPYYTGNFDAVYRLIEAGCERLLAHIREQASL